MREYCGREALILGSEATLRIGKIKNVRGPWVSYQPVPFRWVEIKKKDATGLATPKKIWFCPHCGGKVSFSRFGILVAGVRREFSNAMGTCKDCGQVISVVPRFVKVPYL